MHTIYVKETASKRRVHRTEFIYIYIYIFSKKEKRSERIVKKKGKKEERFHSSKFRFIAIFENDSILKSIEVQSPIYICDSGRFDDTILLESTGSWLTKSKFDIVLLSRIIARRSIFVRLDPSGSRPVCKFSRNIVS